MNSQSVNIPIVPAAAMAAISFQSMTDPPSERASLMRNGFESDDGQEFAPNARCTSDWNQATPVSCFGDSRPLA